MSINRYPIIVFWSEKDGVWIADAPDLKSCSAHGATPEDAVRELSTAMELWIETVTAAGESLPTPHHRPTLDAAE
jgi:predicted RNase H-like HicB family nuclease